MRVNKDGTIPADNPYAGSPNGVRCGILTANNARGGSAAGPRQLCTETYSWGFRNPFRFAMNPDADTTSFRVNDVGGGYIEEISIGQKGADYGWNCREGRRVNSNTGRCDPLPKSVGPIYQYSHNTGCSSITGAAFVPNNAGWPLSYRDAYLYGDYVCGRIFALRPKAGGGYSNTTLATGLQGGPTSMTFGPDGALYYTTYAGGGQVRRVSFVDNKAPEAKLQASPSDPQTGEIYGPTPLTVSFDASGSTDPEGQNLTYEWDFGDANAGATEQHTYQAAGAYTATVTATDDKGNTDTAKVTVYAGNAGPPQPDIESITVGGEAKDTFEVDQQISLQGSAADDDGQQPTLEWSVIRHHTAPNTHEHTYLKFEEAAPSFEAPGPEDLLSTNPDGNYLEIRLTATDSQGLSRTVKEVLRPETTDVRFSTAPKGLYLVVNGERIKAPRTILAWERSNLNVYAPTQKRSGDRYVFRNWSDGKANRHTIETPQDFANYAVRFRKK